MAGTYPTNPALPQGDSETEVNPTNWNTLVDNINAIGADLVDARGDDEAFPGTDHTSGQATDLDDILQAIKHMIGSHLNGAGAYWYSLPVRFLELHPEYPGEVLTLSLRGAAASGTNIVTRSSDHDVVSNVAHNYHETTSAEAALQDGYVAILITLPDDFDAWAASNALQIDFQTESGTSANCHVDAYIYQSGDVTAAASSENNANTSWSTITIDDSVLDSAHSWSAGDIMEIYIKLETRNNYHARCGKIRLNYTS